MEVRKEVKDNGEKVVISHNCKAWLSEDPKWDSTISWEVVYRKHKDTDGGWLNAEISLRDCFKYIELDFSSTNEEAVYNKLDTLLGQLQLFRKSYSEVLEKRKLLEGKGEEWEEMQDSLEGDRTGFEFEGNTYIIKRDEECSKCTFYGDDYLCRKVTSVWNCLLGVNEVAIKVG